MGAIPDVLALKKINMGRHLTLPKMQATKKEAHYLQDLSD